MAWYKTGTVSVQNGETSVTGVSTKFASNTRVGDGFRGPDGEWYEIVNIASETVLGIYPAYQGPTISTSPNYMVAPLQGYNKESADRLREITNSFRDVSDEVASAVAAAAAAKVSETNSKASETSANASAVSASQSATTSSQNAAQTTSDRELAMSAATEADSARDAANNSANAAALSASNAATSENNAGVSETNTVQKASEAAQSAANALSSSNAASASESAARSSEQAAGQSATTASNAATQTGQDRTATEAARTAAEIARDEAVAAAGTVTGGIIDRGAIDLSGGVYPTKPTTSSIWKVTVGGTVNGIQYTVGDSLAYSLALDEFYKIDNSDSVTSVNGYGGIVVLNKADVGLSNVDNTSDADKPVSNAATIALSNKVDKVSGKQLSDENYTLLEKSKLNGIADGATSNSSDATLLNRANHTGTQLASTISDLSAAVRLVTASGLSLSNAAILSTDTILVALGKAQGQINANITSISAKASSGVNSDITRLTAIDSTGFGLLRDGLPTFTGATSTVVGVKGLVPAPGTLGANPKFLSDDGTFKEASGGGGNNIGDISPWKFSRATIPGGRLPNDGQIVTNGRTLYPEFWALIQPFCVNDAVWLASPYTSRGMFSSGDGSTNFRMPDDNAKHADGNTISAMVLRGDGKNSAGTPGLHQADQLQEFEIGLNSQMLRVIPGDVATGQGPAPTAIGGVARTALGSVSSSFNGKLSVMAAGSYGTLARTGSETRSANSTVIWCTTVAKTGVNAGTVDVTVLSNTVGQQGTTIADIQSKQVFTKKWTSAAITQALSTDFTLTHNLGDHFKLAKVYLVATGATGIGISAGERVEISASTAFNGSTIYGCQLTKSTVNNVLFTIGASGIIIIRSDTKAAYALTNAPSMWNIFVELYA